MAAFIVSTSEIHESIKGGDRSMRALAEQYEKYQYDCAATLTSFAAAHAATEGNVQQEDENQLQIQARRLRLERKALSAMILHDMKTRDSICDLLKRDVVSEKDFGWRVKSRCSHWFRMFHAIPICVGHFLYASQLSRCRSHDFPRSELTPCLSFLSEPT
jgi:hypothetical protein